MRCDDVWDGPDGRRHNEVQCTELHAGTSGGSRGGRLGQLPRAPREGGTKEGRAKITRICMTKNVIDFIVLNNQMFRINDIDIYNINQYSVALH